MALPNLGLANNAGQWDNSGSLGRKRALANESKAMDEVLGSNVSKDYSKVGNIMREPRGLPSISSTDPNVKMQNRANAASMQAESFKNVRPSSQEKNLERISSREAMEMYKSPPMNYYSDQNEKVDGLERTIKYLIDQVNGFEKMLYNESRRNKSYYDTEKEHIERLETAIKLYEDNYSVGNGDLNNKLNLLEARLLREEKAKIELREKLSFSEANQRELLEYVKSLQSQENHELIQMRSMLQEKMTEGQSAAIKEKERSKTLFHEVVRLGEQQEKYAEQIQTLNMALESRIQSFEAKFSVNDRALASLSEKGVSGLNNLNEWNDRVEKRVQGMESNLYALTREQVKDKETIAKLEAINNKLSEDLAQLLGSLHSDYQQKLDARVTELVNRIVMEHEERVKHQEDFKQQVDIRDQINVERSQYEREEMRERYNSMDALVRAEFERKDESIRTLHNIIETQVRALQAAIKQEELGRNQFEGYLREEMGRFQDDVKKEFDGFRQQQIITTEKLTEMIKIEIDTRLSSDIELKNQINTIAHNISQDIEILKDNMEAQVDGLSKEIRTIAADSAERANQLSRYIDQEVATMNQSFNSKYEKLKTLFAKFGEQFKNHLLNTESFRKETLTKVQEIEQTIEFNKDEARSNLIELERRLDEKFREQKELLAATLDNNNRVLEDKMNKVKEQEEGDIEVLKEAIENSRNIFNNKLQKLMELTETAHRNMANSLAKTLTDLEAVRGVVHTLKTELENIGIAFSEDMMELKAYVETQLMNERAIRNQLLEESYDNLKKTQNDINSNINLLRLADDKLTKTVDDVEKRYDDRFHSFSNQLSEAFLKLAGLNDNLANFEEKSKEEQVELVSRVTADNVLLQNDTRMLFTELKKVVEAVYKENSKTKDFQEKVISFMINLGKESEEIKQKVEQDILVTLDNKLMNVLEKIKKDDQAQWEQSLAHVKTNFKDIGLFVTQPATKSKLHELVTQDETYQNPLVKAKFAPTAETSQQQGSTTQQQSSLPQQSGYQGQGQGQGQGQAPKK